MEFKLTLNAKIFIRPQDLNTNEAINFNLSEANLSLTPISKGPDGAKIKTEAASLTCSTHEESTPTETQALPERPDPLPVLPEVLLEC